ncbi:MAG: hypothetical protein JSS65_03485 [Armatimonadetes bacterium]|nr:hypothetical protein [Armatimonadota bacterium]
MKISVLCAVATALLLCGCNGAANEEAPEPKKPVVLFEGSIDKAMVGTWKAEGVDQTYKFFEDGTFTMDQTIRVPKGDPMTTHTKGEWRHNGDKVVIKDAQKNIVPYACKLDGDKMELSLTGSLKVTTKLKKSTD